MEHEELLFAAVGCPWYYQGQSERIECDWLYPECKKSTQPLTLPEPLTPTREGASSYSAINKEHMNFVMLGALPGRTQPITPFLRSWKLQVH